MALKEFYVEHPAALDDASKLILEDLQLALAEGVPVTLGQRKVRLRFCVTGIKGDLPFLIEAIWNAILGVRLAVVKVT